MVNNLIRLKKSSDYTRLKLNGKRLTGFKFIIVNYMVIPEPVTKYGITITTKVGPSTLRNKLKRWCREYMRLHEKNLSNPRHLEINFIFKIPSKADFYSKMEFSGFCKEMDSIFAKIRSLI